MGQWIDTSVTDLGSLEGNVRYWTYNGMDCCVTTELFENLESMRKGKDQIAYDFVRAMQAPALAMSCRGFKIDQMKKIDMIADLEVRAAKVQGMLDKFAEAVWGKGLNPGSPKQLVDFFYGVLRLPPQKKYSKGKESITVDNKAMETLSAAYPHVKPIFASIQRVRDLKKKVGTLRTGVDADGRMRTSYNVAGTETGRWSSNENPFGTGTNLQNITDELRVIFEADPGYKIAYFDLEQAESRAVGYISGDDGYIHACESGDLHTTVCKMVWSELPWVNDLKGDKGVANQPYYRHFSYRDMAKRGGHGTNYLGQPRTMAGHLQVEVKIMEDFQYKYFSQFPGIRKWHHNVLRAIQTTGQITTPLGRRRYFLGRKDDNATWREAVAFVPQSTIGEVLNLGLYRVWHQLELIERKCKVLAQVHDAILVLYKVEDEEYVLRRVKELIEVPIPMGERTLLIPSGTPEVGFNWGKFTAEPDVKKKKKANPLGLKSWQGHDDRNSQTSR